MKFLVVGSGGREHAIALQLAKSERVEEVIVAPGNGGITGTKITTIAISEQEHQSLADLAREKRIDYAIVGPEVPLLAGLADVLEEAGVPTLGPSQKAALIEGSKDFAKQFMKKYAIPTAEFQTFTDYETAKAYLDKQGAPIVIKADGLAAGKGVVVAETMEIATIALKDMLLEDKFSKAGEHKVVIEEFLSGEEFSLMAFVNGEAVYPMEIAQDHKRAYEGDKGPNTGGMGAYSPVRHIDSSLVDTAVRTVLEKTALGLVQEGRPFKGILYAGLIATEEGPKVIEFNARFGDPETQVVLPRLESDFASLVADLLDGKVPDVRFKTEGTTLGVVLASSGYPGDYETGKPLKRLADLTDEVHVFHAGTKAEKDGSFVSNGGRVLLLQTEAESMNAARAKLYKEMEKLDDPNFFYRMDIGTREE